MLLGGLIGFIAWMFIPRQYTASVLQNTGIDYSRTGKLENLEEERIIGVVEDVLHSDEVMGEVFRASGADDYRDFFADTRISRTNDTWRLSLRDRDAEKAGKLTLLWLDAAYDALYDHMEHSVRAEALRNELDGLTLCLRSSGSAGFTAVCDTDPESMRKKIDALSEELFAEEKASGGLSTAIRIGRKHPDRLDIRPASLPASAGTLAGAFCGLLAAFAVVWLPPRREQA